MVALSEEVLANGCPIRLEAIHRLLGAQLEKVNKFVIIAIIRCNLISLVIDEASGGGYRRWRAEREALPEHCHVIFLGDKDQLASAEAGAVLRDGCRFA